MAKQLLKAIPGNQITKWTDIFRQMGAQKICWSAYTGWTLLNLKGIFSPLEEGHFPPRCWWNGWTVAWGIQTLSRKGIINQFPNVFGAAGADGPTPARGNQSLGLDSFLARIMQLVRLTLLKWTCCSNLSDSFCRKIGLGFLKIIIPLKFSSSLFPASGITDQACSLLSTWLPGQGKAILEGFIIPVRYQ